MAAPEPRGGPAAARGGGNRGDGRAGPAAVLFDMDGLLVDTEPLWTIAEHELAARYGRMFTPDIKTAMIGQGIDTALPIMLSMLGVPEADPADAADFMLARVTELFGDRERIRPFPGALELLDTLAAAGVPTALVSSSFRGLMDPVLDVVGRHLFAATVAGDEVSLRKPAPEPYLKAAAMLGADPTRCVVLEDSSSGAVAGIAAGCPTIIIPSHYGTVEPPGATVLSRLLDVTLDVLAEVAALGNAAAGTELAS